jgi:hypothetical protein
MDTLERTLLWLGVEDYTGLWQVSIEIAGVREGYSAEEVLTFARRLTASLLSKGWIDLFICQEPLDNASVQRVLPGDQAVVLDDNASWVAPEPYGRSVRYATTATGLAAYKEEVGWTA